MGKERITTTVGVFAGIVNEITAKLLLRRRIEQGSINPGESFKGCWELPGGGVEDKEKVPYDHLIRELEREIYEEVGISVPVAPMAPLYAVLFKGANRYDLAMVVPIVTSLSPTKGETMWVSPAELNKLAKDFVRPDKERGVEGKGLLSGYGKRMHCMALKALTFSPNLAYALAAERILAEIQKEW